MSVADPVGFTYAFGKLEQAIEELVGAGEVKERLTRQIAPLRYGRVSGGRTAPPLVAESVRRIEGACRTIRLHWTRRGY